MKLTIRPLTPGLWLKFEDLFGRNGASNGCWCMYWRIGSAYRRRARDSNKSAFRDIVNQDPPPGFLAFDGEFPVGWCQFTSRNALPWLDLRLAGKENEPVWSISCFYVKKGYRRKGVMSALVGATIQAARKIGVYAIEAYPVDIKEPKSTRNLFTGVASTFERAGFKRVGRLSQYRLRMRLNLHSAEI
jgi:GNAT superfamily N-acetyltransferase